MKKVHGLFAGIFVLLLASCGSKVEFEGELYETTGLAGDRPVLVSEVDDQYYVYDGSKKLGPFDRTYNRTIIGKKVYFAARTEVKGDSKYSVYNGSSMSEQYDDIDDFVVKEKYIYYEYENSDKKYVSFNGKSYGPFEKIKRQIYDDTVLFTGTKQGDLYIYANGKEVGPVDSIEEVIDVNGTCIFIYEKRGEYFFNDGKKDSEAYVVAGILKKSPDNSKYAYVYKDKSDDIYIQTNDKKYGPYDGVDNLYFSDTNKLVVFASKGYQDYLVREGMDDFEYDSVVDKCIDDDGYFRVAALKKGYIYSVACTAERNYDQTMNDFADIFGDYDDNKYFQITDIGVIWGYEAPDGQYEISTTYPYPQDTVNNKNAVYKCGLNTKYGRLQVYPTAVYDGSVFVRNNAWFYTNSSWYKYRDFSRIDTLSDHNNPTYYVQRVQQAVYSPDKRDIWMTGEASEKDDSLSKGYTYVFKNGVKFSKYGYSTVGTLKFNKNNDVMYSIRDGFFIGEKEYEFDGLSVSKYLTLNKDNLTDEERNDIAEYYGVDGCKATNGVFYYTEKNKGGFTKIYTAKNEYGPFDSVKYFDGKIVTVLDNVAEVLTVK